VPLNGECGKSAVTRKVMCRRRVIHCTVIISIRSRAITFTTLGISLREARFLTSADSHRADRSAWWTKISPALWPNGGALGQRGVQGKRLGRRKTIYFVGVVGAVKQRSSRNRRARAGLPAVHGFRRLHIFVVTRRASARSIAETLRNGTRG